jgi:hypothetical protein
MNTILFTIKDNDLHVLKSFDPAEFFNEYQKDPEQSHRSVLFSSKISHDGLSSIIVNGDGFTYLNHSDFDLFEAFKEDLPNNANATALMGKPYEDYSQKASESGVHLFAFSEADIEDYKKDKSLFNRVVAHAKKLKSESTIVENDFISARILNIKESPITYLAYIPKEYALWLQVNKQLITFCANKNIEI